MRAEPGCVVLLAGHQLSDADPIAALLDTEARRLAQATPQGVITCGPCQDFRTDVSFGMEHPCRHCQPLRFKVWRLLAEPNRLLVLFGDERCRVLLPPAGGSVVQPCEGARCDHGCVFVELEAGGGAWWAELDDFEILTPWEGA